MAQENQPITDSERREYMRAVADLRDMAREFLPALRSVVSDGQINYLTLATMRRRAGKAARQESPGGR